MHDVNLDHLREAIALARAARQHGNHPFGALLTDAQGAVVLRAENSVNTESDCTGHAEANLVRLASARFTPAELEHCTLYTSTEPCAMCAAAIHWANIGRVVYALSEVSLYEIIGPSPHHLYLECREVFARSQRPIEVVGPLLEDEARLVQLGFWSDPM